MKDMNSASNRSLLPGVLLIVVGLVMLLATTTGVGGRLIPGAIGVCFLAAYAYQRRYGFLVAGSILIGLGAGVALDSSLGGHGAAVVTGLGLGFMAIFAIDSLRGTHQSHWWPLIPGSVLLLVGLEMATQDETALTWLANWWPLALIVAGVLAIVRAASRPRNTS
ncbi:MAG TPA: hypothetical protein VIP52_15010 [Candidatus Dormibacteraeota bacterium]|jgi:hypothetical protein